MRGYLRKAKKKLSVCVVFLLLFQQLTGMHTYAAGVDETLCGSHTYSYDGYMVEVNIPASWDSSYNVVITIHNTGADTIHNWGFVMETTNSIEGMYNAVELSNSDGIHLIKNAGYNQDIPAGGSVVLGYTARYESSASVPQSFALASVEKQVEQADCTVSLFQSDAWEDGGIAQLLVENTGDTSIEDWMLEFDSTMDIADIWGAVIEDHEEEHFFLRNPDYAQNIAPGESAVVGILFSGTVADVANVEVRKIIVDTAVKDKGQGAHDGGGDDGNDKDDSVDDNGVVSGNIPFTDREPFENTDRYAIVELDTSTAEEDVGRIFYKEILFLDEIGETQDGLPCVNDQLLLTVKEGIVYEDVEDLLKSYNARIVGCIELLGHYQVEYNVHLSKEELEEQIETLGMLDCVENAGYNLLWLDEPNYYTSDPWEDFVDENYVPDEWTPDMPSGNNWGIEAIDLGGALEKLGVVSYEADGEAVNNLSGLEYSKIGIIDNYFDTLHKDLKKNFKKQWTSMTPSTLRRLTSSVSEDSSEWRNYVHGTHVAGIIGAEFDNGIGLCGVSVKSKIYGFSMQQKREEIENLYKSKEDGDYVFIESNSTFKLQCALETMITVAKAKVINYSMGYSDVAFAASYTNSYGQKDKRSIFSIGYIEAQSHFVASQLDKLLNKGYDFLIITSAGNENNEEYYAFDIDGELKEFRKNKTFWGTGVSKKILFNMSGFVSVKKYNKSGNKFIYKNIDTSITYGGSNSNAVNKSSTPVDAKYNNAFCYIPESSLCYDHIICVGAMDKFVGIKGLEYKVAEFSDQGDRVDILAPGVDIYSCITGDCYEQLPGTSMAAPFVSGAAGLILSAYPNTKCTTLKSWIINSAKNRGLYKNVLNVSSLADMANAFQNPLTCRLELNVVDESGTPVKGADVRIIGTSITAHYIFTYIATHNAQNSSKFQVNLRTDENGHVECYIPGGNCFVLADKDGKYGGNIEVGWIDARSIYHDGLLPGINQPRKLTLREYANIERSAAVDFQMLENNSYKINACTVRLYKGWNLSEYKDPICEVTGDDQSNIWGHVYVGAPAGAYTAEITHDGYETEYREIIINDGVQYLYVNLRPSDDTLYPFP